MDGIKNGGETGVDCGGPCAPCNGGCTADACQVPPPDTSCATQPAVADAAAPVLFFSDLDSGPVNGGLDDNGVFVTLYGLRFGDTQGESVVTIGGKPARAITQWNPPDASVRQRARGLEVITFQPGHD